ncbi:HDOD domain-containing protein [Sulfurimonas lithotrophica]|uniref:HDOD domain-containing protein n=1 Tax=Sulfurimonas lithotrophica TaxID=2590022 RepID=A0A5P8P169_9BACT|nr:HDOD domain-containing protein [Sulfurimonas lithotrophica]QFR49370.1 HDOD domain-containing protein [Sulfurimonas lithotrophica]
MNYNSLVNTIESLPPLSNAATMIQKLYEHGAAEVNISKLVKLIESDAVLTANILKMINSPLYGFSRQIASVAQAVTLFGTDMVYGLVIHYAINERMKANTDMFGVSPTIFNDICQLQSSLVTQWYSKIDTRQAQFLAPLALIMESGKLVMAEDIIKGDYIQDFKIQYQKAKDPLSYEDSIFGTSSYFVSGMLFEHWNLEPLYVEILKALDYEQEYTTNKVQSYADTLAVIKTAINPREILTKESVLKAARLVDNQGFDKDYFISVALRIKKAYIENLKKR